MFHDAPSVLSGEEPTATPVTRKPTTVRPTTRRSTESRKNNGETLFFLEIEFKIGIYPRTSNFGCYSILDSSSFKSERFNF